MTDDRDDPDSTDDGEREPEAEERPDSDDAKEVREYPDKMMRTGHAGYHEKGGDADR